MARRKGPKAPLVSRQIIRNVRKGSTRKNRKKRGSKPLVQNNDPTSIWLDLENCTIPSDLQEAYVYQRIRMALKRRHYTGPVSIRAIFARWTMHITEKSVKELKKIKCYNLGYDNEDNIPPANAADLHILDEIDEWLRKPQNLPPKNVMIISGDQIFHQKLLQLRELHYKTLAAFRPNTGGDLVKNFVNESWLWRNLLLLPVERGRRHSFGKLQGEEEEEEEEEEEDIPMSERTFESLGLSSKTLQAIHGMSFQHMTLAQANSIPELLKGIPVYCIADAGYGKTLACLIPAVELVVKEKGVGVIICPELELQKTKNMAHRLLNPHSLKVSFLIGGNTQLQSEGQMLLIATAKSFLEQLQAGHSYNHLKCLMIDGADRVMEEQNSLENMKTIIKKLPKVCTGLFTANQTCEVQALDAMLKKKKKKKRKASGSDGSKAKRAKS